MLDAVRTTSLLWCRSSALVGFLLIVVCLFQLPGALESLHGLSFFNSATRGGADSRRRSNREHIYAYFTE